ncbi:MAG: hypothetical protein KIH69_017920 [Anaerolineae bacterium]|nr:hypothetical protein [Anaerolineae bacterium]
MSRIQPLDPNNPDTRQRVPLIMRPIYWLTKRMVGKIITPMMVQAHRPSIAIVGNLLGQVIEGSGKVNLRLHKMAQIRSAQLIGCPF